MITKLRRTGAAFLVCSIFLASYLLHAQERVGAKSFLWKVRAKSSTVYILGSVHFLKKENYPLSRSIENAFNDAKKLVLEIDLEKVSLEAQQQMMLKGTYEGDKTLQGSISTEAFTLAGKRTRELGLDIQLLNNFKPWYVALTIVTLKLQKLGFDPNYGIDRYFFSKAKAAKKEIIGFETIEYQISLLDQMAPRAQELMLLQTLRGLDVMEKEFNKIVSAWTSGDVKTVETLLLTSFKEFPEVHEKLIGERNRSWFNKIETFLAQGENYVVVVGAGHLVGKDGIIEMLKERGYSIEQL